jgi:hypothetical protein
MDDSLIQLQQVLPPPALPGLPPAWPVVEAELGVTLPPDYKRYIEEYGEGCVDEFLWVLHPTTSNVNLRLAVQVRRQLDAQRTIREGFPHDIPYALFPEPHGLLPWAFTDNGDVCFWLTAGPPHAWTIIVNEGRGPLWDSFAGSMTDFLVSVLVRAYQCPIFPNDFPSDAPRFTTERSSKSCDTGS